MARKIAVIATAVVLGGCAKAPSGAERLWPGSRYTVAQRDAAVLRGLDYLEQLAEPEAAFEEHSDEFIWCFQIIADSAVEPRLAEGAREIGERLALRWKALYPGLPWDADASEVWSLATTLAVVEKLGVRHSRLRSQLERAIPKYSTEDWLDFDPATEPPPLRNYPGPKGKPARRLMNMDVYYDALISTYFAREFGVRMGGSFDDVIDWLPQAYPYPTRDELTEEDFYDFIYLVTHIVYTRNGYGTRSLSPLELPHEIQFLLRTVDIPMKDGDSETLAEYLDSLKSFGITARNHPELGKAVDMLMATQRDDGSWIPPDTEPDDVYTLYHTTWNAMEALRDFRYELSPVHPAYGPTVAHASRAVR